MNWRTREMQVFVYVSEQGATAVIGAVKSFALEVHDGEVYGHLGFRDPEVYGREHLDFDPRGQKIVVMQGDAAILEVDFPLE